MSYHINPSTGNANVCRAKLGNCPYEKDFAEHYSTKDEARKAYEETMEYPVSDFSKLVLLRSKTQARILELFHKGEKSFENEEMKYLVEKRGRIIKSMEDFSLSSVDDSGRGELKDPVKMSEIPVDHLSNDRFGSHNDIELFKKEYLEIWEYLQTASTEWIRRCNSREAHGIAKYSGDSLFYAKAVKNNEKKDIEDLHKAFDKSPLFEKPITVYSGLSTETRDMVLGQLGNGTNKIVLNRALSTSVNPAQVNGFMRSDDMLKTGVENYVALEIETNRGGVMTSVSHSPHEFEILLPPGEYEIIEERENISYYWCYKNEKPFGRTANKTLRLRLLDEEK